MHSPVDLPRKFFNRPGYEGPGRATVTCLYDSSRSLHFYEPFVFPPPSDGVGTTIVFRRSILPSVSPSEIGSSDLEPFYSRERSAEVKLCRL